MNTGDTNTRHDGEETPAPPKLVAALKELPARRVFVPPVVDDAIVRAARRHLAGTVRSKNGLIRLFQIWPAWLRTAAACLGAIGVIYFLARPDRRNSNLAREDLNQDGQVDILDAFQLARTAQSGKAPASGDLNGDGVVDQRDAELIAAQAVKLEKGGRS